MILNEPDYPSCPLLNATTPHLSDLQQNGRGGCTSGARNSVPDFPSSFPTTSSPRAKCMPHMAQDNNNQLRAAYDTMASSRLLHQARDIDRAALNPLLKESFPSFYDSALTPNMFRLGYGNHGPWSDLGRHLTYLRSPCDLPQDRQRCEKFMRPEASWRRMLPCWPPADEFQVNLDCCYKDPSRLARLGFRNDGVDNAKTTKSHPPWLCFGMIYDLLEAAWFQGVPNYVSSVQFEYLGLDQRAGYGFCPVSRDALVSEEFRSSAIPCAGRVCINIHLDLTLEEERQKIHAEAFQNRETEHAKSRKMFAPKQCVPRRSPKAPYIFRDEFHFDDGISFEDIAWDEVHEYSFPPRPPRAPVEERQPRSRFSGLSRDSFGLGPALLLTGPLVLLDKARRKPVRGRS